MEQRIFLKTQDGQYVTILEDDEGLKLCAVDHQNDGTDLPPVDVMSRNKTKMALRFQFKNKFYFLMVDNSTLKLQETAADQGETRSDHYQFNKKNVKGNKYYCLQSVHDPSKYLAVQENIRPFYFCLSTHNNSVIVKNEIIKS